MERDGKVMKAGDAKWRENQAGLGSVYLAVHQYESAKQCLLER